MNDGLEKDVNQQRKVRHETHILSTLDHRRLRAIDFQDLSNRKSIHIKLDTMIPELATVRRLRNHYERRRPVSFAPNTRGFMYYLSPPPHLPLAGEIRSRVTESCDPSSFASGFDMLAECKLPFQIPWNIPLITLADGRAIEASKYLSSLSPPASPGRPDLKFRFRACSRRISQSPTHNQVDNHTSVEYSPTGRFWNAIQVGVYRRGKSWMHGSFGFYGLSNKKVPIHR